MSKRFAVVTLIALLVWGAAVPLLSTLVGRLSYEKPYEEADVPLLLPDDGILTALPDAARDTVQSSTTVPFRPPVLSNADNNTNAAFNTMMSDSGGVRYIWDKAKVTIDGSGLGGGRNLEVLQETVAHINSLKYPNIPLLEIGYMPGDISLHSLEQTIWSSVLGTFEAKPKVDGLTRNVWDDDGSLVKSTIVVDSSSDQWQRNRTIVHELLHSLGLGHHRCPSGILEQSAVYSPLWKLNVFDELLLRMQYASARDLAILSANPEPCLKVLWETLNDSDRGSTLWCQVEQDPRKCVPVSPDSEPSGETSPVAWISDGALLYYDPQLYTGYTYESAKILCKNTPVGSSRECSIAEDNTFGDVILWLRDNTLYDYNIERYLRFRYNGSKLLCYIPSVEVRSECQYTEGNSIDRVDAWTDGERVYGSSR